jgi:hypothetical protein
MSTWTHLGLALATVFALQFIAANAEASKETFVRNKPHVNVGTVGNVDSTPNPNKLAAPQGGSAASGNSASGDCNPDPSKSSDRPSC